MIKRKLLLGVLVVLGIAVTFYNPLISLILAVGVWIYLVRIVGKQKNSIVNDQMEPTMTERHLQRLKAFLIVAGIAFLFFVVGAILHNVLHDLSKTEQTVSFLIALAALWVFVVATAGGMVIVLKERQRTT